MNGDQSSKLRGQSTTARSTVDHVLEAVDVVVVLEDVVEPRDLDYPLQIGRYQAIALDPFCQLRPFTW